MTRQAMAVFTRSSAVGLMLGAVVAGCQGRVATEPAAKVGPTSPVDRGRYLVTAVGCNDCHTPLKMGPNGPEPDMTLQLSGHPETLQLPPPPKLQEGPWIWTGTGTMTAFAGPWGISYGANLTPDQDTGIGAWTEEIFVNAIRTGKHWGQSRPILPPMPWTWYAKMTDEDLKAMYAYLRTIPPIKNRVPDPIIAGAAAP